VRGALGNWRPYRDLLETGIPNQQPEAEAVCMVLASIVRATRAQESSDVICSPMRSGSKAYRVPT